MIIALDYGTKRVGVAISEDTESIALAVDAIVYTSYEELIEEIGKLIKKYSPNTILLGLPLGHEEKPTQMSNQIKDFALDLEERYRVSTKFWNEVMTSKMAGKIVKDNRKGNLDSQSARIILQEYLDFKNI